MPTVKVNGPRYERISEVLKWTLLCIFKERLLLLRTY